MQLWEQQYPLVPHNEISFMIKNKIRVIGLKYKYPLSQENYRYIMEVALQCNLTATELNHVNYSRLY
jgi:hypothetical protein